jgi:hypothetical protein
MKKISYALIIALIVVLLAFSSAVAALPGRGWWSALRIQNISATAGDIKLAAYDKDVSKAPIGSELFSFQPSKSLVYDPGKSPNYPSGNSIGFQSSLGTGFEGSVVLSSTVEAASVSQIANYANGSVGGSGKASAMYQGVGSGMLDTTLLAPTIKHNYSGATTTLYIQAASTDAHVVVTYTMANGRVYTDDADISANRMYVFDPAAAGVPSTNCGYDTMVSPCFGSAVITSTTGKIAGVLLEHPHSGTPVTYVQAIQLSIQDDASTKLYVPGVKNEFCGSSGCGVAGAEIMNIGDSTANVKIMLTVTKLGTNASGNVKKGDVFKYSATIPPKTNYNFSKWNNNLGGLPEGTLAAAVIECTNGQLLIGASNDTKTIPGYNGKAKLKYSAFSDTLATPYVYAPMVKEFLSPFTGGVNVQNVGVAADYINIEYHLYNSDQVCILRTKSKVPVGGAAETNWVSVIGSKQFSISGSCSSFSWLSGKEFSVKAYTDTEQNIVMMVTENTPKGTLDINRYEAVNALE